ncbi:MAG: carbonic anhydrase [Candidatus Latescibacteria bacterium]|nr:carbonic anhydrase [Candidatus Latescibacterota bacterium]
MFRNKLLPLSLGLNLVLVASFFVGFTGPNVPTSFNPDTEKPRVAETAFVHHLASVVGDVMIGERVFVAPCASVRGDEGQPIYIGDESNVQDGVVIHGLETFEDGKEIEKNQVEVDGKKYSVYIGRQTSLAHQSQVHGPAKVGNNVFIGMQALVFKAEVGDSVVIEPGAKVIGVKIPSGRYVPAGYIVTRPEVVDILPEITADYPFKNLNDGVIHVNTQLADGNNGRWGKHEEHREVPMEEVKRSREEGKTTRVKK